MAIFQLKQYPQVCRLCLKPPDPSPGNMIPLTAQDEIFDGTIEDFITSITFVTEKSHLFPRKVCSACFETLRYFAKFYTKLMNAHLLMNALAELRHSSNSVPLEELFRAKKSMLRDLFKDLDLCDEGDVSVEYLIGEFSRFCYSESTSDTECQDDPEIGEDPVDSVNDEDIATEFQNIPTTSEDPVDAVNGEDNATEFQNIPTTSEDPVDAVNGKDNAIKFQNIPTTGKDRVDSVNDEDNAMDFQNIPTTGEDRVDSVNDEYIATEFKNIPTTNEDRVDSGNDADIAVTEQVEVVIDQSEAAKPQKRGRPRKEIKTLRCRQADCTAVFHDRKSFEHHRWTAHKKFVCELCGQQCASRNTLDMHKARHKNEEAFQCQYCQRAYNVKKDLVYHIKQIHVARDTFQCDTCGLELKHKATLECHKLTHQDVFGFPCPQCEKKFKTQRHLSVHKHRVHKEPSYDCDQCDKVYRSRLELLDHIEKSHGIKMRHFCDVCVEIFDSEDQLDAHKARHRAPTKQECGTCLTVFTSKDKKLNHLCITYRDDYICCGKDHSHHGTYNRHMFLKHGVRVNVRVKPGEVLPGKLRTKRKQNCPKCDKVFIIGLPLKRHVKTCDFVSSLKS